jgi:hypothetical protein
MCRKRDKDSKPLDPGTFKMQSPLSLQTSQTGAHLKATCLLEALLCLPLARSVVVSSTNISQTGWLEADC